MKLAEIRNSFLSYFNKNGHTVVSSSPLVPVNDDTLLFTNAGMVQFKDIFVGLEKRNYTRATTSQKCVRAGGKHNDLEQVGYTSRHHTFFEMLGNFSFGDYFKDDAINFAWNFITKELCIPQEKLLVTVYHTDEDAKAIWRKVAGRNLKIIPIETKDNFWSMGDTGPCGPCTEIFYDHGENVFGGMPGTPNESGDRFTEIWNLVFMEFEQKNDGSIVDLKAKSIDTGMGLERIAAVLQGKTDNYDIDLFSAIISDIRNYSQKDITEHNKPSYKAIADHLRAVSFLIADGVFPSNEGRGYVLRRILRRAINHGNSIGIKEPFIHKLVPNLVELMKEPYNELKVMQHTIESTVLSEEERFIKTLDIGLNILKSEMSKISKGGLIDGAAAFKLYDTYGFPLDLTINIARENGYSVDSKVFEEEMLKQKNRANWKNSAYDKSNETVFFDLKNNVETQEFVGYDTTECTGKILGIVVDGSNVDRIEEGTKAYVITSKTAFYAECGGQVGDTGTIHKSLGNFVVEDTKKIGDLIVHNGYVERGVFSVNENVTLSVDEDKRKRTSAHHSVTHLLHSALREVVGQHVAQKGSFVGPDYLRFDFCSNIALTKEQINAVEDLVNKWTMSCCKVEKTIMSKEDATKEGAIALFGEKYGNEVRVVSMTNNGHKVSVELCGGTHVDNSGEIGLFKVLSESSVGAGIRRIEAVAGNAFLEFVSKKVDILNNVSDVLKTTEDKLLEKICSITDLQKNTAKELLSAKLDLAMIQTNECEVIGGINLYTCKLKNTTINDLKVIVDTIAQKLEYGIFVCFSKNDTAYQFVVKVTKNLHDRITAKNVVDIMVSNLDAKGGGKADFAQGGIGSLENFNIVIKKIDEYLKSL